MKEYFKEQLRNPKLVNKENLSELKGRTLYGGYKEGDRIFVFMLQEIEDRKSSDTMPSINLILKTVVERDFDKLKDDFEFVRMSTKFPVLKERIKKSITER